MAGYPLISFNRGRVSELSLGRLDLSRVSLSADVMTNMIPRVLGPMSLRPGWKYLLSTNSNNQAIYIPFVFSVTDTALLEITDEVMRVVVGDELVLRETVTASISNGTFTSNLTGWTDNDEAGATSAWVTGGYMGLTGNGHVAAIRDQHVVINETGTEHALRVVIERGPVLLRVGSTLGGDEVIGETTLESGTHSLAFTPSGDIYIRFLSRLLRVVYVDSCTIESSGTVEITSSWAEADLNKIRYVQSGDVIFVACAGYEPQRIERRGTTSWSVVRYAPEDGPIRNYNVTPITMTPTALSGNTTLTASANYFTEDNVGSLMHLESIGQTVTVNVTAQNTFTDAIKIVGIDTDRVFSIILDGSVWAGGTVITLQRSFVSDAGPWSDVPTKTWTADVETTHDDNLDNINAWYRIGCKTGDYAGADDIDCTLDYSAGTIQGYGRITAYSSPTSVSIEVLDPFGGTGATEIWAEGRWSDRRGWPTSVALHDGRLWWAGQDRIIGSISDAFDSFDHEFEGDAGPIDRSIGIGPVDTIEWILSLQRLVVGGQGAEFSIRASSFDEPLTPTDFTLKAPSRQGSAPVQGVPLDQSALFIQRGGYKVYSMEFTGDQIDYSTKDITVLVPEMGSPGIVRLAVQRQPDTRIHCVRSDGTVMLAVFDPTEDVLGWVDVETTGYVEDVVVLPGTGEEDVYYVVKRSIEGKTVRYLEKWAQESECRGGESSRLADSFVSYTSPGSATLTGLDHLEGERVVVWADGEDVGTASDGSLTYRVVSGQITLDSIPTYAVVGLPYTGQWKSTKLMANEIAAAIGANKKIRHLSFILAYTHKKGIEYGPDFDNLDELPDIEEGTSVSEETHTHYHEDPVEFNGQWIVDARVCIQAKAPRSCTVLGIMPEF